MTPDAIHERLKKIEKLLEDMRGVTVEYQQKMLVMQAERTLIIKQNDLRHEQHEAHLAEERKAREELVRKLWGIASGALLALIGALVALLK